MADDTANANPEIEACIAALKLKIPAEDHAALESRLHALINDPDADANDVVMILRQEFDPGIE